MTKSKIEQAFDFWWLNEGSGMAPMRNEEICVFAKDITRIAWLNGAYCASREAEKPKLCYIENQWAYFTTRAVEDQWGDGWGSVAYEHNAGDPYHFLERDKEHGVIPWEIVKVAWEGDFQVPCDGHLNSPWSVQLINTGQVCWLRVPRWRTPIKGAPMELFAGANLQEFRDFIHGNGGVVYESVGAK